MRNFRWLKPFLVNHLQPEGKHAFCLCRVELPVQGILHLVSLTQEGSDPEALAMDIQSAVARVGALMLPICTRKCLAYTL